jgi:virulence factor BrkB
VKGASKELGCSDFRIYCCTALNSEGYPPAEAHQLFTSDRAGDFAEGRVTEYPVRVKRVVRGWSEHPGGWRSEQRLSVGRDAALFGFGVDLLLGAERQTGLEVDHTGAVFAVVSLFVASLLFSLYLRFAPSYSATYGSIGAVVILMLWLYLMGSVILIAVRSTPRSRTPRTNP